MVNVAQGEVRPCNGRAQEMAAVQSRRGEEAEVGDEGGCSASQTNHIDHMWSTVGLCRNINVPIGSAAVCHCLRRGGRGP
jgi:hypothetical protein